MTPMAAVKASPLIRALDRAYDAGKDWAMYDVATLITEMHDGGQDDAAIVAAIEAAVALRMVVGLPVSEMFGEAP